MSGERGEKREGRMDRGGEREGEGAEEEERWKSVGSYQYNTQSAPNLPTDPIHIQKSTFHSFIYFPSPFHLARGVNNLKPLKFVLRTIPSRSSDDGSMIFI